MTEIQNYLLKLLGEIDTICCENNIDYCIFAGSMLGLERNEGFLPWDDYIDVVMTKSNYDRFAEVMKKKPIQNRKFECKEENEEYPLEFGKYMSTETSHITRSLSFGNSDAGIWIDIMYVVPLPKSEKKVQRIKNWFCCFCELQNELYVEHVNRYDGFFWRYKVGRILIRIFGRKKVLSFFKKSFNKYSEDECNSYFLYHSLDADFRIFDKRFFEKPIRRIYNGIEVNASPYNREFSRAAYGDSWMIVPPETQQIVHTVVLDFDTPGLKYIEDYMVFLEKEDISNAIKNVKKRQFKEIEKRKSNIIKMHYIKGLLLGEKLNSIIEEENIDVLKLAEDDNYYLIGELYKDYLEMQFSQAFRYWKVFVDINDELLYPILKKLICYDGEYYNADKILNLRNMFNQTSLNDNLKKLRELIEFCRKLSIAVWDEKNLERAESLINDYSLLEYNPFCIDVELIKLKISIEKNNSIEEYHKIKTEALKLLRMIREQGECLKLIGDIEYLLGNSTKALNYYKKAELFTHNGLVLLDIRKRRALNDEK